MKPQVEPASQDTQQSTGVSEEANGRTGRVRVRSDEPDSWRTHQEKAARREGFLQLRQRNTEDLTVSWNIYDTEDGDQLTGLSSALRTN